MIYFLIPIYNEEGNIRNLYEEISNILPNEHTYYVFSDDGSKDKTKELITDCFKNTKYTILGDGLNRGPGAAFNFGFEWILKHSNSDDDIIVTLEADCTSDITLLPKMLAVNRLGYDLVLASVYAQGGGFDETNWFRKLLSSIANLFLRYLFEIKVLTLSSFYRVYSISLIKKIKINNSKIISESGFISMLEILVKSIKVKATIVELPMILYSKKRDGRSKMKILKTSLAY
jgi:dolichol-phosphate mannosyltransferase